MTRTFLGESVGVFLKFINLYFRYHAHLSGVRAIVPTTEYFVMTSLEGDFNTGRISSRIGEWNTPIQEGYLEKLVVKVVPPGQSLGQKRVVINPITWTKALNSPPLGQASSSRWLGTVHTIKDPKLIEAFEKQYFDFYSPYGSWSLEKSPLEITQPAYRQEFWQFRNLILGSTADQ